MITSHIDNPPDPTAQIPVRHMGEPLPDSTRIPVLGVHPDWGSDYKGPPPDNPLEDYQQSLQRKKVSPSEGQRPLDPNFETQMILVPLVP
jgi:hypothetical protein